MSEEKAAYRANINETEYEAEYNIDYYANLFMGIETQLEFGSCNWRVVNHDHREKMWKRFVSEIQSQGYRMIFVGEYMSLKGTEKLFNKWTSERGSDTPRAGEVVDELTRLRAESEILRAAIVAINDNRNKGMGLDRSGNVVCAGNCNAASGYHKDSCAVKIALDLVGEGKA